MWYVTCGLCCMLRCMLCAVCYVLHAGCVEILCVLRYDLVAYVRCMQCAAHGVRDVLVV